MKATRTILAATDFSGSGRNAMLRAARLADELGAALHVIHVARAKSANDADLAFRIGRDCARPVSVRITRGPLLEEIERAQNEVDADLTVLGARGSSMARHVLLGSTAERLLAGARRAMLVVRLPAALPYRRVLAAVDLTDASLPIVRGARRLAPEAHISVLHAYDAAFEGKLRYADVDRDRIADYVRSEESAALARMGAFMRQAGDDRALDPILMRGHPLPCVLDRSMQLDCELVAVGGSGRSRAEDFLLGSLSRRILAQSHADVLLQPKQKDPDRETQVLGNWRGWQDSNADRSHPA